jgi:hypothetical protein
MDSHRRIAIITGALLLTGSSPLRSTSAGSQGVGLTRLSKSSLGLWQLQSEGIDLAGYAVTETIDDVGAARIALGYDRINQQAARLLHRRVAHMAQRRIQ